MADFWLGVILSSAVWVVLFGVGFFWLLEQASLEREQARLDGYLEGREDEQRADRNWRQAA
jgi:uncharacterized membrane protein YedE/YeeE